MIEIDGAFYRISKPSFEMLIPRWEGCAPETADQADATITLSDGTRRSATFMTLGVVSKIMDRWRDTGECLSGRYFWCSDLVVIREPGFDSMIAAVQDVIATGEIDDACGVPPPLDEEAVDQ
ncbi:hypothetical protein [Nonomuraea angiospora]|uniref:hypothetical protein n=1 Tax=Nonomuraea angiospora TaxID=46172 RepID=UPI0029B625CF|nr:hypothetical protein [Nonomuraea angiospora]MDX3105601.1 hypothetical protein [Nonomuraea angiospora]